MTDLAPASSTLAAIGAARRRTNSTEFAMTITPADLLDTSIAQLHTLAAFLGDQLDGSGGGGDVQSASSEVCACKDALVALSVLIPRLQAARTRTSRSESAGKRTAYDEN